MLALMPQPPSLSFYAPAPLASSGISVAILPSAPPACAPNSAPAPLAHNNKSSSPSKRPKLSLNTANVPCLYGKGTSSLRMETLSATSPTSRNTFQNTLSPRTEQARPISTPTRLTSSPQPLDHSDDEDEETYSHHDDSDYSDRASSSGSSYSNASSATTYSVSDDVPYQLPNDASSILCNGPIAKTRQRKVPRHTFSSQKTVSFRTPLTEVVKTTKYVLSNVDLDEMPSPSPVLSKQTSPKQPKATQTKGSHEARDSDESVMCPATPVAGKRKRDRHWVWTLGSSTSDKPSDGEARSSPVASG